MAPAHILCLYGTNHSGMDVNAAALVLMKWERRQLQRLFSFSSKECVDSLSGWSHYSRPIAYDA